MRPINLREYARSEPLSLTVRERDALKRTIADLTIAPVLGESNQYWLTPSATVGAIEIEDLSVLIEPKIRIRQLLSIACYAVALVKFRESEFDFSETTTLPDALALALSTAARPAFSRGLLRGYLTEDDSLYTVRGRIRFDDQLRRRFGFPLPVEVRYDEYTGDVLENRLVKAATRRLSSLQLRSSQSRDGLRQVAARLEEVSLVDYVQSAVPEVTFDRLNTHYQGVVALSRLVLRHGEYGAARGSVRASGFLMDMNAVFQEFVTSALREALQLSAPAFREQEIHRLDDRNRVGLKPDLVWKEGKRIVFVGDAKYKHLENGRVPNSDLYQLLAYTTAEDLPGGLLIYAEGGAGELEFTIRHAGKRLRVMALDLSGSLDAVLNRIRRIASVVRELRSKAVRNHLAT